jgi:plastocyanin
MAVARSGLAAGAWGSLILLFPPLQPAAWAKTLVVVIDDVAFGPTPADARVGDVVEWKNQDFVAHTATARDGSFDVDLPAGTSAKVPLTKPGEIAFVCRYHPGMAGTISVAR